MYPIEERLLSKKSISLIYIMKRGFQDLKVVFKAVLVASQVWQAVLWVLVGIEAVSVYE